MRKKKYANYKTHNYTLKNFSKGIAAGQKKYIYNENYNDKWRNEAMNTSKIDET